MNSDEFRRRLNKAVKSAEDVIEGEGKYGTEKFQDVTSLINDAIGIDPEAIHAFKLRSNSVDNCLWEGKPLSRRFSLGIAFVPTNVRASKPNNVVSFPRAVIDRMHPGENGFEAIAVCVEGSNGQWRVTDVVGEKGSSVADALLKLSPSATRHDAERVAAPPPKPKASQGATTKEVSVAAVAEHLEEAKNVILQGPPGTGKSFISEAVVRHMGGQLTESQLEAVRYGNLLSSLGGKFTDLLDAPDAGGVVWERVQLHPGYTYDDFVRGMAASHHEGNMRFVPEDKILVKMARLARARPRTKVILLLDEINRCNLSGVLGELVFAIEPTSRGVPVRLQYARAPERGSEDTVLLPANLLFLGTMNTADRSIGLVDYAIRRRFRFLDLQPSEAVIAAHYAKTPKRRGQAVALFKAVNAAVQEPVLRVGHSYFLVDAGTESQWIEQMADRLFLGVIPLLREYLSEGRPMRLVQLNLLGVAVPLKSVSSFADQAARKSLEKVLAE